MKTIKRKAAALILAVVMIGLVFGGCSPAKEGSEGKTSADDKTTASSTSGSDKETPPDSKNEEPVTLRIFFGDISAPDDGLVADAVSEITQKLINTKVEFVMFGQGEFAEKIPLLLASDEKMDIGFDAGWIDYVGRSRAGAYLDLTELLKTTPDLYKAIDPLLWQGVTIDGGIYGVPTYKELAEQWALYAETDFLKENNIDPKSITKLADAEVILEALKKDPNRAGFMITAVLSASSPSFVALDMMDYYDVILDSYVVSKEEGKTVVDYWMTEEYESFVRLMRDWYNKGYIASDVATREGYDEYTDNDIHNYGLGLVSYSPLNEVASSKSYGKDLTPIPITPITTTNGSTRGSINCIYAKSEHPDRAIQFLELWNTKPEIKNLITFGIEGKHYNLVDGKVEPVPDVDKLYLNQNWRTGNMFISYLMVGEPDDKYDKYLEFNDQAVASVVLGFTPDTKSIDDKIAACRGAFKEYGNLLSVGAIDPDEYLPKLRDALKAAGSDDIVAELQKQLDEWNKSK